MQTQIIREIATVDQSNHLHLDIDIPEGFSKQVEVFILPSVIQGDECDLDDSYSMAELQMQSNFVKKELSDSAEDVWNDYL